MARYLDPKNDFAFKKLFGEEKNKDLLIELLNQVLKRQLHKKIKKVTFLNPFQEPETLAKKQSVVDVLCEDNDGCQYIIEMQIASHRGFEARAQYYAAKAFGSQMVKGGIYADLKEVIFLAFTNFNIFPEKNHYKSEHIILDRDTYEHDLDKFSFTFVNLPKFNKTQGKNIKNLTREERFYYFLHNANTVDLDTLQVLLKDTKIKKAFDVVNRAQFSDKELRIYDQVMKNQIDAESVVAEGVFQGEKKGIEKGIKIGIEKGEKIGIEKGRQEGIEKGEKIGIEKGRQEVIQNLLKAGSITQEQADKIL